MTKEIIFTANAARTFQSLGRSPKNEINKKLEMLNYSEGAKPFLYYLLGTNLIALKAGYYVVLLSDEKDKWIVAEIILEHMFNC